MGCADILGRIVEDLKDESEPYRRMVMETIDKVGGPCHCVERMPLARICASAAHAVGCCVPAGAGAGAMLASLWMMHLDLLASSQSVSPCQLHARLGQVSGTPAWTAGVCDSFAIKDHPLSPKDCYETCWHFRLAGGARPGDC